MHVINSSNMASSIAETGVLQSFFRRFQRHLGFISKYRHRERSRNTRYVIAIDDLAGMGSEHNEKKMRDAQMRAQINQSLVETGERDKLKELLRIRLVECGWRDQLKHHCKEVVRQKGLEHITVDDLVAEITPKGRALVPDQVKKELLQRIRTFLSQQPDMRDV